MKGKYVENKFNKLKYVVKHIILNLNCLYNVNIQFTTVNQKTE